MKVVKHAIAKEGKGINLTHKLHLMEAELLSMDKRKSPEEVRRVYNAAIRAANRCGFRHDAAWANERAGQFCSRAGDSIRARDYLAEAVALFQDWGAYGVQRHLQAEHKIHVNGTVIGGKLSSTHTDRKRHSGLDFAAAAYELANIDSRGFFEKDKSDRDRSFRKKAAQMGRGISTPAFRLDNDSNTTRGGGVMLRRLSAD